MVSSVSSSRFSLMMLGSGTTRSANFHTESSKVAEKRSIWHFSVSSLWGYKEMPKNIATREPRCQRKVLGFHRWLLCSESNAPVDPYALVPMTLCGDHHVSLVEHKHSNLLGVNELVLGAPVEDGARCSDNNLLLQLSASLHWKQCENPCDAMSNCGTLKEVKYNFGRALQQKILQLWSNSYFCFPEWRRPVLRRGKTSPSARLLDRSAERARTSARCTGTERPKRFG